jgi:hypothetical protein
MPAAYFLPCQSLSQVRDAPLSVFEGIRLSVERRYEPVITKLRKNVVHRVSHQLTTRVSDTPQLPRFYVGFVFARRLCQFAGRIKKAPRKAHVPGGQRTLRLFRERLDPITLSLADMQRCVALRMTGVYRGGGRRPCLPTASGSTFTS